MSAVIGSPRGKDATVVAVEYSNGGKRETKTFKGLKAAFQARSFYAKQYKLGNEPKVISGSR